jgi:hypothetical protein
MKTWNRSTKLLAMVIVVASIWATWGASPAQAIVIINGKTGLFGLTAGQTVRVSVLNDAQTKGGIIPCVGILNMDGNVIAEVEGTMPLLQGQGTFFDFDARSLGLREGQRMQIRAKVELTPTDNTRLQPDDVILTLEVFDNTTGRTAFTMPWVLKGFNPQPEPPAR